MLVEMWSSMFLRFGFISFKAHLRLASFGPLIFVQNIIVEIVHSVSAAYFRLSE